MSEDIFPVVIIGGGLAGLTAAVHLANKQIPPLVLEADRHWPGGRLCGGDPDTFEYNGQEWSFQPDQGMHALWGGYDNMRATLQRFTDIQLVPSTGEEWINRWGRQVRTIEAGNAIRSRWIPAPFHYLQLLFHPSIWNTINPFDFLSLPGYLFSTLWTVGFDPIGEKVAMDGLMLKDFFRGWTPNLKATFTGLGVNLLAAPPESISLTAFIAALRFYTTLRRDSWQLHYFPESPPGSLIKTLIDNIESHDGLVMTGTTAIKLEQKPYGWRVLVEDSARGGIRSIQTRQVILATDAPASERILKNGEDTRSQAQDIIFPSALRNAVIRMWFNTSPREGTAGGMMTGDFVPDNFFWLHRIYDDFYQWHQSTGGSAVEVHIYGSENLMDKPDNHLLILAVNDIQHAFPNLKGHFVHGVVRRNIRTHTQFRVPTHNSLHVTTPWENIFACGDWIGYPTPSMWMERASVTGIAAANCILIDPYPIQEPKRAELLAIILSIIIRGIRMLFRPIINYIRKR